MQAAKRISSSVVTFIFLLLLIVGWWQKQNIYDEWQLHDYTPSPQIAALADNDTMVPSARRLFYINHAALEEGAAFNQHCGSEQEQTIVLGCYIKGRGIYLFNVTDKQLQGVEEVTAAHETLHAAYDRLSSSEKKHIDELVKQTYAGVTDQRIKTNVQSYQDAGADVANELHSILGTEVHDLPAELEQYYARYFTNRERVVSYSDQYEAVFTANQTKLQNLNNQINQLKKELSAAQAQINADQATLDAENQRLTSLRNQNRISEYNAGVDSYNALLSKVKAEIAAYNAKVDTLNNLIQEYNQTAVLQQGLYKSLDSKAAAPSL